MNAKHLHTKLILLGVVIGIAAPTINAQQTQLPEGAVEIVFENKMLVETELFWIDENSQEQSYGTIAPGAEYSQQSYPGHRWRVRAAGAIVKDLVATNSPLTKAWITGEKETGQVKPAKRSYKATNSGLVFSELDDGTWNSFVPSAGPVNVSFYRASRDDQYGVMLNRENGASYLLSPKGLYEAAAGATDWTFVEAGNFVKTAATNRKWQTTQDPSNKWVGVLSEQSGGIWQRQDRVTKAVDQWKTEKEDNDGLYLTGVDDPSSTLLISNGTLYYPRAGAWLPLAQGNWANSQTAVSGQPVAASVNPASANPTAAGASMVGANTGSRVTQQDAMAALKVHNDARQRVGVAPMTWSAAVAKSAQTWANQLAAEDPGDAKHDPRLREWTPYGENVSWLSGGTGTAVIGSNDWLEERAIWESNGNGETGHYTQMVWHSTKELGIGVAVGASGSVYIVGRYNRAGNYDGEAPYPGAKRLPQ